jgi:glycosyl-4,4'-diaponeurosporenoate acyltransferase
VISLFNAFFLPWKFGVSVGHVLLAVWVAVLVEVAINALAATLIRRALPQKWFDHKKKVFTVGAKEKKFYEKLKIRKWKDRVPELGMFTNFSKGEIADPHNPAYLERFLLEACYGEVIHFVLPFLCFLVLLVYPQYWYCIGLPVALVGVFMNLPSLFILRYNSYKLEILRKSNLKKQKRAAAKEQFLQPIAHESAAEVVAEVAVADAGI